MAHTRTVSFLNYNVFGAPFHGERIVRSLLKTRVRKRFFLIAQEIVRLNIDVLLLQEVHTYPHFIYLRYLLKTYRYCAYEPSFYGPRGGLVTFSKFPLDNKRYIDFAKRGVLWNKSITGLLTQKGILRVRLKDSPLWILNTHLTQDSDQDWSLQSKYAPYIQAQLAQCVQVIKLLEQKGDVVIAAGDFNISSESPIFHQFMENLQMTDVFSGVKLPNFFKWFTHEKIEKRLDYVFVSLNKNVKIEKKAYIFDKAYHIRNKEMFLSDHLGLLTTISLSER